MGTAAAFRIISGGQTGVDRAALDVALEKGIACGGWCPRGRRAEDGPIASRYPLRETPSDSYPERTRRNLREADATLVITTGPADRGTALTIELASRHHKPLLQVDLDVSSDAQQVEDFLRQHAVRVLNVAGPRQSRKPGIHARAVEFLRRVRFEPDPGGQPGVGSGRN